MNRLEFVLQRVELLKNFLRWKIFTLKYSTVTEKPKWDFINEVKSDGGASQILRIWSLINFSNFLDSSFKYQGILNVEHNYQNDDSLHKKWELVFLKDLFPNLEENNRSHENYIKCSSVWKIRKDILRYEFEHALDFWIRYPEEFRIFATEIRDRYWSSQNIKPKNKKNIVVHIRRGDVDKKDFIRYLTNDYYISMIKSLKIDKPEYKVEIITNESNSENLAFWRKYGTVITHLDLDPIESIKKIATADVFIASRSSMSTVGALLSKGDVYYPKFSQPFLKDWNNSNNFS